MASTTDIDILKLLALNDGRRIFSGYVTNWKLLSFGVWQSSLSLVSGNMLWEIGGGVLVQSEWGDRLSSQDGMDEVEHTKY